MPSGAGGGGGGRDFHLLVFLPVPVQPMPAPFSTTSPNALRKPKSSRTKSHRTGPPSRDRIPTAMRQRSGEIFRFLSRIYGVRRETGKE